MVQCAGARVAGVLAALASVAAVGSAAAGSPVALVFETADKWTHATGAVEALTAAGFEVRPWSPDSTFDGVNLLVFGSFASESPEYARLARDKRTELLAFIERGGVLLHMTQADQTEEAPLFLPDGVIARRGDADLDALIVLDGQHPLLSGLPTEKTGDQAEIRLPKHLSRPPNWESFEEQRGFHVLLASDTHRHHAALLEAALGKGRLVLTSLFLDKRLGAAGEPIGEPAFRQASDRFFANLRMYVEAVAAGRAPHVTASEPYGPPPPLPFVEGSFTIVALPDTQVYAESYPDLFEAQTRWIVENRTARNIVFVVQLGDVTNRNTREQWENARRAISRLDGHVPYAIAPGNHDCGPGGGMQNRETLLNEYFPPETFAKQPTFGGLYEPGHLENTYHLFSAGGREWIVVALEFGPRDPVVEWADRVLREHADRVAIIITHAYMYYDDTRYDHVRHPEQKWSPYASPSAKLPGGTNDGEELWRKLVATRDNVAFVLSGHVLNDGAGRLSSPTPQGNVVHQILANYQMRTRGGEGYLRLIEFLPDGRTVQVKTYSPDLDRYLTDEQQQFRLELTPPLHAPPATAAGANGGLPASAAGG